MREAVKNWHQVLNGDTPDAAKLQNQVKRLRLQRNILLSIIVSYGSHCIRKSLDRQADR